MKLAELVMLPIECWVTIWRGIGSLGYENHVDEALRNILRIIWVLLSCVGFPALIISLILGL